ncbi:MAG: SlyX family protein [Gammaproteobacteria bacterium]|mgnify:CR=1 FL=1|jgi:SlyX protein|nr:SlyX family protein [Gammaproteobacteria bacterium]MDP6653345.1 SlyX family protein [Gammaproteobacteria bacterium]|tara:strand:+ start:1076 stop:1285 length:210 start_codon:yes stop_codon:yes gene_type:complete
MEQKIIELETKFSFQEDLLQGLNDALIQQQRQLDQLRLDLERLQSHIVELQEANLSGAENTQREKPPHY